MGHLGSSSHFLVAIHVRREITRSALACLCLCNMFVRCSISFLVSVWEARQDVGNRDLNLKKETRGLSRPPDSEQGLGLGFGCPLQRLVADIRTGATTRP
ncbi:hypothetical protein BJX66DRAFT_310102 [Aspergillus keveii]|uniref:Secreted protein n=1 Tax=Aspergillus keveii TaxID=714993 RepID=A0ABR4FX12_9EURO